MKKLIALLLALSMVLSLAACGASNEPAAPTEGTPATEPADVVETVEYVDPYAGLEYEEQSEAIYNLVLGEFAEAYEAAKSVSNLSERWALMAVAEAKLLETGVMTPLTADGGNWAISRAVPNTVTSMMYGNDSDRYHNILVATEPLLAADRDELKALWAEVKGTGTWEAEAKKLLEEKGYTLKDTYTIAYNTDPQTWDILATSRATDAEAIVNTYDGLVEYNSENVMMGALATEWTESEDGLTYTFKLREGVKWVDSQGREVAEVTADDFVAGMQHLMDVQGGLEWLIDGVILNADQYISGEITDFTQVGVKAVDTYTVEYTLAAPCSYFMTMLSYNLFAPMSRSYYESQGGKFGTEYDSSAATYTYGSSPDNIAYCGPYLVTNATAQNTIVFNANPSYWNAENINVKTITWLYNDGSEQTKAYNDAVSGVTDGAGLNASAVEAAKADGWFESGHVYVAATGSFSFPAFVNVNRLATANFNDETVAVSGKTEEEMTRSRAALYNQNFRLALTQALDRGAFNAATDGEELKYAAMVNSYTPGTFVYLAEDTTIDINGTATTFPAGTAFGEVVQAQVTADGYAMKVYDPEGDGGAGSSGGYDGWYNPEAAVAALELAIEELAAQGVEISPENPIKLELPYASGIEVYANRANVYKQSIETVLGGNVVISLVDAVDQDGWLYAGFYPNFGSEGNYDVYDNSGWGPDYGDPQTYLDTFLPDYAGYMVKMIGLY